MSNAHRPNRYSRSVSSPLCGALALAAFLLLLCAPSSLAAKRPVDFIGSKAGGELGGEFRTAAGVAVNDSGAGGVPAGTIYATDGGSFDHGERGNRIEVFRRNDHGTPANAYDDTYEFVAAWGAGVEKGGTDYEICTVALKCRDGAGVGGNGTLAGDGALSKPGGIAVDQDTGDVYVADSSSRRTPDGNFRINVYSATGQFLRSFGWGVVESGPDDNGTGYEICKASVDICRAGTAGSGAGQIGSRPNGEIAAESIAVSPDGNPSTGSVFLTDQMNRRVIVYHLDGSSPSSISFPADSAFVSLGSITVDSRGILYVTNVIPQYGSSAVVRYDTANADGEGVGFLAPLTEPSNEIQQVKVTASSGQYKLSFEGESTADLPYNATASEIQNALAALPAIGAGNIQVNSGVGAGGLGGAFTFPGALAHTNVPQIVASNGSTPLSGGSAEVTTLNQGTNGPLTGAEALAVEPDPDGAGPKTDVLYVGNANTIQQFGPLNPPGLAPPPVAADEVHEAGARIALAAEPSTGRLYSAEGAGIYVLDNVGPPPTASLDSISGITAHSAEVHATVSPNGPPATSYRLEFSVDGTNWESTPEVTLGTQETPQAVTIALQPAAGGLLANTLYHLRLVATRKLAKSVLSNEKTFTTLGAAPLVDTTGSPIRTTTTALINGMVDPQGNATTYRFEYGTEGPCETSPCTATEAHPAGSGSVYRFVSQQLEGLEPDTTYHYRVIAGNGQGSPAYGEDMTVMTRASEEPLTHGHFPGPPESDRAYEQVSLPDSGGNPVSAINAISSNGERVFYAIHGGNPISTFASQFNEVFSERTPSGWQNKNIFPSREESVGSGWVLPYATPDLSALTAVNASGEVGLTALYRLFPDGSPSKVWGPSTRQGFLEPHVSDDLSRMTVDIAAAGKTDVFDITSGTPEEIDQLPNGSFPACGANQKSERVARATHWLSADGKLSYFGSEGNFCGSEPQLYVRNLEAGETKRVSPPPVSGGTCRAYLIRSTPGAAFFWSKSRLVAADAEASGCSGDGGDIYRYDLASESVECLTCRPGVSADVRSAQRIETAIAVAEDGSRVYFTSPHRLVPGGGPGLYRVNVANGEIAYVADSGGVGTDVENGESISPDGKTLVFMSASSDLNAIGGQQNGGTLQYYLYDDRDQSLSCASCPQDGSVPSATVSREILLDKDQTGPNMAPISSDGSVFAFATATPLLEADQNTPPQGQGQGPGTDVYEWRDGRLLLVSDGLTNWARRPINGEEIEAPQVAGVSPSGRDIFFTASAQYTPDALDGYRRIYDARLGGGFEYPPPPKPCPLEVCQGTPKGTPEEQAPGTNFYSGAGNAQPTTHHHPKKHKKAHKKKAHAKKHTKAASKGRTSR